MTEQTIIKIEAIIEYIETHLNEKLSLDTVATAVHYSKYHLSRLFFDTVGLHLNDYVKRRQLTEAAKLLIFSKKPIIDIALLCGYQSQQSFTAAFKSMYKAPPSEYRANRNFYPLQLRFTLEKNPPKEPLTHADICLATESDIVDWMTLMHLTIDGYPEMNEDDYLFHLRTGILENQAPNTPQYRKHHRPMTRHPPRRKHHVGDIRRMLGVSTESVWVLTQKHV